jgi:hypothetical protein
MSVPDGMQNSSNIGTPTPADDITQIGTASALLARARTVALVGNGPVGRDNAAEIDAADLVIRMNRAQMCGVAGRRTDVLVLNAYLEKAFGAYGKPIVGAARRDAREIWVRHNKPGRSIIDGRPIVTFGRDTMLRASANLAAHGAPPERDTPSLGASALQYLIERSEAEILLYGFTHKGNEVHCWDAERRWTDSLVADGLVRRIPQKGKLVRQPLSSILEVQFTRLMNHIRGVRF